MSRVPLFVIATVASLGFFSARGDEVATSKPATNAPAVAPVANQRYKIAVCDWMILKRQKLGAFQLAKDIGADGVEVDMGSLSTNETFASQITTNAVLRQQFLDKARDLGLEIPSIAMSGFYAQSFAERPTVSRMTQDCIDTMKAMSVKISFLPLGVRSDLVKHPEFRTNVVARLKIVGAQAEKAGVIIGLESELPAAEQIKLLDEVGSPAIKLYYNFANAIQNGYDLIAELKIVGKDRLCQIHCTDQDGVWLQDDPKIDMPKVKQTLDEMGWSGWLVIERSRKASDSRNVRGNFGANTAYLKKVFQAEHYGVQISYYDRNNDGKVDLEKHQHSGAGDMDWELRDDDFDGKYEKEVFFGYVVKESAVEIQVPSGVKLESHP